MAFVGLGNQIGEALCKAVGIDVKQTPVHSISLHFAADDVATMRIVAYVDRKCEQTIERVFRAITWEEIHSSSGEEVPA